MTTNFYSIEAEQAVLGRLVINNETWEAVSKVLTGNDFYEPKNKLVFETIEGMAKRNENFDMICLTQKLKDEGKLESLRDNGYVFRLASNTPDSANAIMSIMAYAKIVKEKSAQRELIAITTAAQQAVHLGNIALVNEHLHKAQKITECAQTGFSQASGLKVVNVVELLETTCKPRELILSPWLATQSLSMLYACRGVGKTYVALNIAYAVASGNKFFGWDVAKPRGVLFIDGEMPIYALQERVSMIAIGSGKEATQNLLFVTPDLQKSCMPDLATVEGQKQIEPYISDEVELIIVDNLSALIRTGRENEAESWQPIQDWALRLRARGKSVLFVHHSNKSGNQRGTSRREDLLDVVINLKRPSNYTQEKGALFEVHFEKSRYLYGDEVAPFEAQLLTNDDDTQYWTTRSLEESIYEKVINLCKNGRSQKECAIELGVHKSSVSKYLKRAREEGKIKEGDVAVDEQQ